jgi:hypothetical protein
LANPLAPSAQNPQAVCSQKSTIKRDRLVFFSAPLRYGRDEHTGKKVKSGQKSEVCPDIG